MVEQYLKLINNCFNVFKFIGIYHPKDIHICYVVCGTLIRWILIDLSVILMTVEFLRIDNIFDFADLLSVQLIAFSVFLRSYIVTYKFDQIQDLTTDRTAEIC